jgi:hypothetical protein
MIEKFARPFAIDVIVGARASVFHIDAVRKVLFATALGAAMVARDVTRGTEQKRALLTGLDAVELPRRDEEYALRGVVGVGARQAEPTERAPNEIQMSIHERP